MTIINMLKINVQPPAEKIGVEIRRIDVIRWN